MTCDHMKQLSDRVVDIAIAEGDEFTVDALEWYEQWEFDNPKVILRPVYREYDTGSLADAIEDVLIDAVCGGEFRGYDHNYGLSIGTLKRRFREAMNGHTFPVKNFRAKRVRVRITRDRYGLTWEEIE